MRIGTKLQKTVGVFALAVLCTLLAVSAASATDYSEKEVTDLAYYCYYKTSSCGAEMYADGLLYADYYDDVHEDGDLYTRFAAFMADTQFSNAQRTVASDYMTTAQTKLDSANTWLSDDITRATYELARANEKIDDGDYQYSLYDVDHYGGSAQGYLNAAYANYTAASSRLDNAASALSFASGYLTDAGDAISGLGAYLAGFSY